jgi:glyoxylase-like metal-dependent hydrolase (beta-lactamase superfamily II)
MEKTPDAPLQPLLPGVWRVGGGSWGLKDHPNLSVVGDGNVYLVRAARGAFLVDCGGSVGRPAIEANIRRAGFDPAESAGLLLTHSHSDHTGAASEWRAQYGTRIHLHEVGAEHLDRQDTRLLGERCPIFTVDHRVRSGEAFDAAGTPVTGWSVPGHTLDSALYVLELSGRRLGFCGDVCFGPADWDPQPGIIGALSRSWGSNLPDYRDSLKHMAGMGLDALLPGHGRPVLGAEEVQRNLAGALETIERFLATPRIYAFGLNRRA